MNRKAVITCLTLATLLAGCGDDATAPVASNIRSTDSAAMARSSGTGSRFSGYMVGAGDTRAQSAKSTDNPLAELARYKAVKLGKGSNASASADIGPEGGVLRLPETGLTVTVPRGAVAATTHFSVTSQGDMMGYTFEPHGTRFAVPLHATQSLGLTDMLSHLFTSFQVAYFTDDSAVDSVNGTVAARELLTLTMDREVSGVSFDIWHFSGYMLVSARAN